MGTECRSNLVEDHANLRLLFHHHDSSCFYQVEWHSHLDSVPSDSPLLLLAHEFLDALPIHQFVNTERGWRERMIDLRRSSSASSTRIDPSRDVTRTLGNNLVRCMPWQPS